MPLHEMSDNFDMARLRAMWGDPFSVHLLAENKRLAQKFPDLHSDRCEMLAWLKVSEPDRPDEKLLQDMKDFGF